MKKIIQTDSAPAPIGPYNQAVRHNNTLYISGQIALDPETGELDNANILRETERVMNHLEAILKEAGLDFSRVLKCSIFLTDLQQFSAVNEVYASFFDESQAPARETLEVRKLPRGAAVEISAIAGFDES